MAPIAPMRGLALLVATAAADTILGMALVFGSGLVYPAYRAAGHHLLSVVADQQIGGAVLWTGMLPPMIIATVALLLGWLEREECDELSRELDRLTGQAPAAGIPPQAGRPAWASSGWAARAGCRRPTF
jgi:cytochrome c oxidase assembly factor CtaG